jgi:hypothetical protein
MFVMLILTVTLAVLQIESNMFRLKIMSQTGVNLSQFSLLKRQRGIADCLVADVDCCVDAEYFSCNGFVARRKSIKK